MTIGEILLIKGATIYAAPVSVSDFAQASIVCRNRWARPILCLSSHSDCSIAAAIPRRLGCIWSPGSVDAEDDGWFEVDMLLGKMIRGKLLTGYKFTMILRCKRWIRSLILRI